MKFPLYLGLAARRALCLGLLAAVPVVGTTFARGAGAGLGGQGGGVNRISPAPFRPGLPGSTLSNNQDVSALSRQSRLERLTNASNKLFDIIPPEPPDLAVKSPLPGYRLIRLGRKHNNRLCFAATVAGTKGLIMLDTGAANTALNGGTYRSLRLGGTASLPAGIPRALSLNNATAPMAEAPDFQVGPSNLGAVPVCLIPSQYLLDGGPGDGGGQLYDGLLGQNILRHYGAMIDCARLVLYLDLDPAKKLDLAASFARHGWTRVPMIDTGTHYLVPCTLNGRRYRLVVDTGAPFTNLDRGLLKDAQVTTRDVPFRSNLIGKDPEPVSLVDVDRLQIGGYAVRDAHMTATAQSLAEFAGHGDRSLDEPILGLLGGDLLARNGAIIDIGNQAIYFKPAEDTKPAKHRDAR